MSYTHEHRQSRLCYVTSHERKRQTTGVVIDPGNGEFDIHNHGTQTECARLVPLDIFVPHCFPNLNQFISVDHTLDGNAILLTSGQYTSSELATYLQSVWQGAPVSIADLTITFTDDENGGYFTINKGAAGADVDWVAPLEFWQMFGFAHLVTRAGTSATLTIGVGTTTTGIAPNLSGPSFVFLDLGNLAQGNLSDAENDSHRDIICLVPLINTAYGTMAHVEANDIHLEHIDYNPPRILNAFEVKIRDESMRVLSIPANKHVSILFKQYHPLRLP